MRYFCCLLVVLLFCVPTFARDLGVLGYSYAIAEQDFLRYITAKLQKMQAEGILAQKNRELRDSTIAYVKNPPAVQGIGIATKRVHWYYDPTLTVTKDIRDGDGRVFVKKGTKVNPLKYMSLTKTLVFIDGSRENQVNFAVKSIAGNKKIILTKGKTFALMKKLQLPIYFDQKGSLVKRFGIRHVPATVVQEGMRLKVEEVPVE